MNSMYSLYSYNDIPRENIINLFKKYKINNKYMIDIKDHLIYTPYIYFI